jgi:hypothetical protein
LCKDAELFLYIRLWTLVFVNILTKLITANFYFHFFFIKKDFISKFKNLDIIKTNKDSFKFKNLHIIKKIKDQITDQCVLKSRIHCWERQPDGYPWFLLRSHQFSSLNSWSPRGPSRFCSLISWLNHLSDVLNWGQWLSQPTGKHIYYVYLFLNLVFRSCFK